MPLTFADFRPVSLAFEVRYPDAYLLWDRAGQLARDLASRYQVSRLASAEPGKIVFICDTQELTWQLDRMVVVEHQPPASRLDGFYQLCENCLEMTIGNLDVSELSRVGFRPVFGKGFAAKEEAAATLLAMGILRIPSGKQFNVEGLYTYPEYAVRREDEKFGYLLKIFVQEVKYEFEPPPQWRGSLVEARKEQRIAIDLDWYTKASLPVGAFRAKDWLEQIVHSVHRDADRFLGI